MAAAAEEQAFLGGWKKAYDDLWALRDERMDGLPMLSSPLPTLLICLAYVYLVKVAGPKFMEHREPYNLKTFLVIYNAFQVAFSTYIFCLLMKGGWAGSYSLVCQPVDYSNSAESRTMRTATYIYYLSKFSEFIDTFAFIARKKFNQVSALHVIHHGIMPLSVWPGVRWVPGGHSTFFCTINAFIHILMYAYYMLAAMGPRFKRFIWWKRHMTNMQMIQFIAIFIHSIQLFVVPNCGFPIAYGYYIGAHAVLFFVLFGQFYIKEYMRTSAGGAGKRAKNGGLVRQSSDMNMNVEYLRSLVNEDGHSNHEDNKKQL